MKNLMKSSIPSSELPFYVKKNREIAKTCRNKNENSLRFSLNRAYLKKFYVKLSPNYSEMTVTDAFLLYIAIAIENLIFAKNKNICADMINVYYGRRARVRKASENVSLTISFFSRIRDFSEFSDFSKKIFQIINIF